MRAVEMMYVVVVIWPFILANVRGYTCIYSLSLQKTSHKNTTRAVTANITVCLNRTRFRFIDCLLILLVLNGFHRHIIKTGWNWKVGIFIKARDNMRNTLHWWHVYATVWSPRAHIAKTSTSRFSLVHILVLNSLRWHVADTCSS